MSYRDNREALEEKVAELSRELEAAQERHRKDGQLLSELAANIKAVSAAVTHESPNVAPTPAVVNQPGAKTNLALIIAFVALIVTGSFYGVLKVVRQPPPRPTVNGEPVKVVDVPPLAPSAAAAARGPGELVGLAPDGPGFVVATTATTLFKVDAKTLSEVWSRPIDSEMGWAEHETFTLNTGAHLALVTSKGAFFHDDATGALGQQFLWKNEIMPHGACAPGKEQVLVSLPFDGLVRLDANTGQKAASGDTCKAETPTVRCGPDSECGYRSYKTADLDCSRYLRVTSDTYMPCEADDGTRRHLLVSVGADKKERWRIVRASDDSPDFMDLVGGVLIIADSHTVDGYATDTGNRLWSHAREGQKATILGGMTHVVFGFEDTLIAIDTADGKETARFHKTK